MANVCIIEEEDVNIVMHKDVLIVENDVGVNNLLVEFMKHEGFSFDSARKAKGACELIKTTKYKVIIMDIKLNGVNGVELCLAIRKVDKDVAIFAITGLTQLIDEGNLGLAGFDKIFAKPDGWKDLVKAIEGELDVNVRR